MPRFLSPLMFNRKVRIQRNDFLRVEISVTLVVDVMYVWNCQMKYCGHGIVSAHGMSTREWLDKTRRDFEQLARV